MSRNHSGIAIPGVAAVSLSALLLAGCSATDTRVEAGTPAPTEPMSAAPTQSPSPALPTGPLTAPHPGQATVLAQLDDQTGPGFIEGISTDFEALTVSTECEGAGTLEVAVSGLASFSQPCGANARQGIMNQFDVRNVEGVLDITVTAPDDLHWALSVSGGKAIKTVSQPRPTSG